MTRLTIVLATMACLVAHPVRAADGADPFTLHSDPWVNLHHFLYQVSRYVHLGDLRLGNRVRMREEDLGKTLSPEDEAIWLRAMETYAAYGERNVVFDPELIRVKDDAARGPLSFPLGPDASPLYQALLEAMPVYEAHWWAQHDALNQALIARVTPDLERYSEALVAQTELRYGASWPEHPVRVDISPYAHYLGAYTTGDAPPFLPNHILMAADDPDLEGLLATELLFHEVAHGLPFSRLIHPASVAAAEAAGVDEGRTWHHFIFYTAGESMRAVIGDDYVTYAERGRTWTRPGRDVTLAAFREYATPGRDLAEVFLDVHRARAAAQAAD